MTQQSGLGIMLARCLLIFRVSGFTMPGLSAILEKVFLVGHQGQSNALLPEDENDSLSPFHEQYSIIPCLWMVKSYRHSK
jgi:hypothetical protein